MTKIIAVVNVKGGAGKTTTTAHLAHAFAANGKSVCVVDADPAENIIEWSSDGEWRIPTFSKAVPKLHVLLPGIIGNHYDIVLIDTPGFKEKDKDDKGKGIVFGALMAADIALIPLSPTIMDNKRLKDVWASIDTANDMRNEDIPTVVLLNRVHTGASSGQMHRENIEKRGFKVLQTVIPRREAIAQQGWKQPITDLHGYDLVAAELEEV